MRPLDYSTSQPDGLYVRCVCGRAWSMHDETGTCPYGSAPNKYRPMIGKFGRSKNKPIQTYTEAFGHPFDEDADRMFCDVESVYEYEQEFRESHTHTISRAVLNRIAAHGIRDFPNECCGFILGDEVSDVRPILNTNKYKGGSYTMDVPQQLAVLREVEQGKVLKVVYHSHPNMGAFFSGIDRDAASSIDPSQPDWPDTVWIVMSIRSRWREEAGWDNGSYRALNRGRIHLADARAYLWNPAIKDFSEITLKVEDASQETIGR